MGMGRVGKRKDMRDGQEQIPKSALQKLLVNPHNSDRRIKTLRNELLLPPYVFAKLNGDRPNFWKNLRNLEHYDTHLFQKHLKIDIDSLKVDALLFGANLDENGLLAPKDEFNSSQVGRELCILDYPYKQGDALTKEANKYSAGVFQESFEFCTSKRLYQYAVETCFPECVPNHVSANYFTGPFIYTTRNSPFEPKDDLSNCFPGR